MKENNRKAEGRSGRIFNLQERFIEYATNIITFTETIPETKAGKHICSQLLRSGTSPAANYAEAQSAESISDFIHKLKIALKELRETEVWLKILLRINIVKNAKYCNLLRDTDELISILVKSIQTARKNKER